ncbi:hypothetical protein Tco_0517940 [Tanacetum coccineum]
MKCLEASSWCLKKLSTKKLDDFKDKYQVYGRIVRIKRLLDDLEVTAAKVRVTTVKQNLVLFSNLSEKYAKYTARVKLVLLVKIEENILITTADRVTTAERLQLLKDKD